MNINRLETEEDKARLLKALVLLQNDREFNLLLEFLEKEQSIQDKLLRREIDKFQVAQGKSQILEDIFTLVETSADVLDELQNN